MRALSSPPSHDAVPDGRLPTPRGPVYRFAAPGVVTDRRGRCLPRSPLLFRSCVAPACTATQHAEPTR